MGVEAEGYGGGVRDAKPVRHIICAVQCEKKGFLCFWRDLEETIYSAESGWGQRESAAQAGSWKCSERGW